MENIDKIYDLLNSIKVTKNNEVYVREIKDLLATGNYFEALKKMKELKEEEEKIKKENNNVKVEQEIEKEGIYPKQLSNIELERIFIG